MKNLACLFVHAVFLVNVGFSSVIKPKSVKIPPTEDRTSTATIKDGKSLVDIINPQLNPNQDLDLAFIMDTTGSMGSYIKTAKDNIRQIVDDITTSSGVNIKLALIEYRDHVPQESTFVTRFNDFTSSVSTMKSWLTKANAKGGGDGPEAVAEAMFDTTKLSWRPDSTKIAVMISDAPPHGLVPSEDRSFPQGSPNGHDPITLAQDFAQMGVTLYVIGCEPAIYNYKDFFEALAYITGGQYVPLTQPHLLVDAITGGAQEELSLNKFDGLVQAEVQKASVRGGASASIDKEQIANEVFKKLTASGAKSTQLRQNNKALSGPSQEAKQLAKLKSLAEVRKVFKKRQNTRSGLSAVRTMDFPSFRRIGGTPGRGFMRAKGLGGSLSMSPSVLSDLKTSSAKSSASSDKLSTVESTITMDQVRRMVQKKTSKLT